jgi:hypothetical protein
LHPSLLLWLLGRHLRVGHPRSLRSRVPPTCAYSSAGHTFDFARVACAAQAQQGVADALGDAALELQHTPDLASSPPPLPAASLRIACRCIASLVGSLTSTVCFWMQALQGLKEGAPCGSPSLLLQRAACRLILLLQRLCECLRSDGSHARSCQALACMCCQVLGLQTLGCRALGAACMPVSSCSSLLALSCRLQSHVAFLARSLVAVGR